MDYLNTICTGFIHLNFGRRFILKGVQNYRQEHRENKASGKEEKGLRCRQEAPVWG